MPVVERLDPAKRAAEKQASRERDMELIRSGAMTPEQLRQKNDFFAALDITNFRIASIGGRRV